MRLARITWQEGRARGATSACPTTRSNVATSLFFAAALLALAACETSTGTPNGGPCQAHEECASETCVAAVCVDGDLDTDQDGLTNRAEARLGTNPDSDDTDGDGLDDLMEVRNPGHPTDTDGDGKVDALESSLDDRDEDCIPDPLDPNDEVKDENVQAFVADACLRGVCAADPDGVRADCTGGRLQCAVEGVDDYVVDEGPGQCDGLDNDCDGDTDEGSRDTDDNGVADCVDPDDDGDGVDDGTDCAPLEPRCADDCSDGNGDEIPDCAQTCPGDCDDGIDCTDDVCHPTSGCIHVANDLGCDDQNPCTADYCDVEAGCLNEVRSGSCEDGDVCTGPDVCIDGTCVSGEDTCECRADDDCSPLSVNQCDGDTICDTTSLPYRCILDPKTRVVCDGGNDTVCAQNLCDAATGRCRMVQTADGTPCDDGIMCSSVSTCQNGECVGDIDRCDCLEDEDCAAFDDGNMCNGTFFCNRSGFPWRCRPLAGSAVTCPTNADTACVKNTCQPDTGRCILGAVEDGTTCNDGLQCTGNGQCANGVCAPGAPVNCADAFDCTVDTCVEGEGCVHTPSNDRCEDGNSCTTDICVAVSGCVRVSNADPCDDGNPCTTGDHCQARQCIGTANQCECETDADCAAQGVGDLCSGTWRCDRDVFPFACALDTSTAVVCNAAADTFCRANTCVPETGVCSMQPRNEGVRCEDNDDCTTVSECSGGTCTAVESLCECSTDADCEARDDGDVCTGVLACDRSRFPYECRLTPGSVVTCDDSADTFCEANTCDPVTGVCSMQPRNEGVGCDDQNACTTGEQCTGGACTGGSELACDDGYACSVDDCDTSTGCFWTLDDGLCADDGDPCTAVACDLATAETGCTHTPGACACLALAYGSGATARASAADAPDLSGGSGHSFTIELWARVDTFTFGGAGLWGNQLVSKIAANGTDADWSLLAVDDTFIFRPLVPGALMEVAHLTQLVAGEWTHLAVSYDAGTRAVVLYVNGAALPVNILPLDLPDTDGPVHFGPSPYVDAPHFFGALDEIRFWDSALTAGDISARKDQMLFGDEPGLTAYWTFEDLAGGMGTGTIDATGNGHDVTWTDPGDPPTTAATPHLSGCQ